MVLLDSDGFLTQLTRMLEKSREKGVVYVTMKRCELIAIPRAQAVSGAMASIEG